MDLQEVLDLLMAVARKRLERRPLLLWRFELRYLQSSTIGDWSELFRVAELMQRLDVEASHGSAVNVDATVQGALLGIVDNWVASLVPEVQPLRAIVGNRKETPAERCRRHWHACIDAGLTMPTDTYAHLPRGIGEVAQKLGISRQQLARDLNHYRNTIAKS